ncbi:hypothetical protein G8759_31420 [Spirosoma aureum]|uniref:Lipoprotein n=1 Tax=Spirosoma aureum TaxID=2692134 RepID=A0A6G9AX10_9BACT|nr:hypothetical protein [Spirosoma aureum]QIP16835.1 hypothetical protein G8759_31420 [Spirosoma aureum]
MKHLSLFLLSLFLLTGCAKTQYYYLADTSTDLYQMANEQSLIMASVIPTDTLMSWEKLKRADGHFVRVRHQAGSGWVRSLGYQYLYSVRIRSSLFGGGSSTYTTSYSGLRPLDMSKPVHVRAHTRTTKSGKTVYVREHTRSRPGSSSYRSSSKSYRSSGSSRSSYRGRH